MVDRCNSIVEEVVELLEKQPDAQIIAQEYAGKYGCPIWNKAIVVGNSDCYSVLVPMRGDDGNVKSVWGINTYADVTNYTFMYDSPKDPNFAELGWLFDAFRKNIFGKDPDKWMIKTPETSSLKYYAFVCESYEVD